MKNIQKGEYLAPKIEVIELCLCKDLLIAGSGNETLLGGTNMYDDADFD